MNPLLQPDEPMTHVVTKVQILARRYPIALRAVVLIWAFLCVGVLITCLVAAPFVWSAIEATQTAANTQILLSPFINSLFIIILALLSAIAGCACLIHWLRPGEDPPERPQRRFLWPIRLVGSAIIIALAAGFLVLEIGVFAFNVVTLDHHSGLSPADHLAYRAKHTVAHFVHNALFAAMVFVAWRWLWRIKATVAPTHIRHGRDAGAR